MDRNRTGTRRIRGLFNQIKGRVQQAMNRGGRTAPNQRLRGREDRRQELGRTKDRFVRKAGRMSRDDERRGRNRRT